MTAVESKPPDFDSLPSVVEISKMLSNETERLNKNPKREQSLVSLWWNGSTWLIANQYERLNNPSSVPFGWVVLRRRPRSFETLARSLWTSAIQAAASQPSRPAPT